MIRKLDDKSWEWFCTKSNLGKFVSKTNCKDELVRPAETDFDFSDAQTMIKIEQSNGNELYYIFSNEGIINLITPDGKMLLDPNNNSDYELYRKMPELAMINMQFYGMMEAEFGGLYSVPMMTITDMKLRDAKQKKQELGEQIATYNAYNTKKNQCVPHDDLMDIVMLYGKINIPNLSGEYHYVKGYIELQKTILDTFMQNYVGRELEEELEEQIQQIEEELKKRPRLIPDENDPKLFHFVRPERE